ncbi:uncharacterized protein LOC142335169 isoform X2 [Convolutriloba macropyga]|uniref:uncharacterized protein LOC142335169 isoform X2 n=1 Tax=Convolutriloba macropyga TaxID=536237 RepID=UPI003F527AB0
MVKFGRQLQDNHQTCNFLQVRVPTCKFLQVNHPSSSCSAACSVNNACVSFNYCEDELCHLNTATINDNFATLKVQTNSKCVYSGLLDKCTGNDPSVEECAYCDTIYDKHHWSGWTFHSLHNESYNMLRMDFRRSCLESNAVVVSNAYCQGCSRSNITLLWVNERKRWDAARDYCASRDLTLFDLLNGDTEIGLLENYPRYINTDTYSVFWVGVRKIGGVWRSLNGTDVEDFIIWNTGQPGNRPGEDYLNFNVPAYHETGKYAHDALDDGYECFFCY